jgi:hypothetical protein
MAGTPLRTWIGWLADWLAGCAQILAWNRQQVTKHGLQLMEEASVMGCQQLCCMRAALPGMRARSGRCTGGVTQPPVAGLHVL